MSTKPENEGKAAAPVPFFRLETIRKRVDFKAANGGARFSTPGFTLLRAPSPAGAGIRFGFTVTKKLGKAVLRNRIRRRLKAAVQGALRAHGAEMPQQPFDFVILARGAAANLDFATLSADLARAMLTLARREATPNPKPKLGKSAPLA